MSSTVVDIRVEKESGVLETYAHTHVVTKIYWICEDKVMNPLSGFSMVRKYRSAK